jgi:hypothetical protein
LATAVNPSGTVMRKVKVALSDGWSLPGNQVWAPAGSEATNVPSALAIQPMAKGGEAGT